MEYIRRNTACYHHGILGMKWGVRRFQKKNGSLTSAGRRRYSKDEIQSDSEEEKKRSGLSDKQKRAIKIGAAFVATTLATYGTYRLVKSGKMDQHIESGF